MLSKIVLAAFAVLAALALPSGAEAYKHRTLFKFCLKGCHRGPIAVTRDADGNFYVPTIMDKNGQPHGAAFKLTPDGKGYDYRMVKTFETPISPPSTPLIVDTSGNLYGANSDRVFKLSPSRKKGEWTMTTLYSICSGCYPWTSGPLTYAGQASGAPYDGVSPLYGTYPVLGTQGYGMVYEVSQNGGTWSGTVLYSFCSAASCTDGAGTLGGVYIGPNGALYGVTVRGGSSSNCDDGCGTIYELDPPAGKPAGWKLTTLYNFCPKTDCKDGSQPTEPLTMDAQGHLIGTTYSGGDFGGGTLLSLTIDGKHSTETVLHSFCAACADGSQPSSGVVIDATGAIYGETGISTPGKGTVYRYADATFSTLYAFCGDKDLCTDGWQPQGNLLLDENGDLFGVTLYGGKKGRSGTLFELTP
jgi:uncharacterized repeat protein (TIGR03803 family)